MHPELSLPPETVLTRWGTWVSAALLYSENFAAVKEVIETLDDANSKFIATAKDALKDKTAISSLAFIKAHLSFIPELILKLESDGKELTEVVDLIKETLEKAEKWPGKTGKLVKEKLQFVLRRNPGWNDVIELAKMLKGEPSSELKFTPAEAASLKYLPLVSADIERSFSALKLLVTDLRKSFKTEHVEKVLVIQYNNSHFL